MMALRAAVFVVMLIGSILSYFVMLPMTGDMLWLAPGFICGGVAIGLNAWEISADKPPSQPQSAVQRSAALEQEAGLLFHGIFLLDGYWLQTEIWLPNFLLGGMTRETVWVNKWEGVDQEFRLPDGTLVERRDSERGPGTQYRIGDSPWMQPLDGHNWAPADLVQGWDPVARRYRLHDGTSVRAPISNPHHQKR